ncbi:DUF962 domain-containing protein [Hymenobacter sp. AT01-02]|uniref:DUF962 domain-containing protein n=1 Tax=Hymenobacter sp. AT01-02 TaxID=1571877 RepID=UPI0005F1B41F|nr:DUF962 domain-containing protein [Hymenobacter sp. AT01-02]
MSAPSTNTFAEFYHRYLREHSQRGTRIFHFVGTSLFLAATGLAVAWQRPWLILGGVVAAYGCAWVGHFFVERNRPATFQHPWWSLLGDFRLYWELLRGREKF